MYSIKMIAMDMDGTLLNSQQEMTSYTRDVLISLQEKGKSVVLASGRDIQSLMKYGEMLNLHQYPQSGYICLNGLGIYDSLGKQLHKEKGLTYQNSLFLETIAKKYSLDMIFFFKETLFIIEYGHSGIIEHHFINSLKHKIQKVEDIPRHYFEDLRKVALIQRETVIEEILDSLQEEVHHQLNLCRVERDWIEVNPLGIHKGNALKQYAFIKKIPLKHVVAFGNGENDIEMLKVAGRGVAMYNSFQSVKEIADDICGSCEEDGIGKYLKEENR